MTVSIKKRSNYYNASPSVVNGLNKILRYEKTHLEFGKKSTHRNLSPLQARERRNITKTKYDVVQKNFLSTTNLLYFFEFVAENDLLHKVFEKDEMSFFGAKKAPNKYFNDENTAIMAELIDVAMLHRNFGPKNYRMSLLEYMQYTVSQIISLISITKLNNEVSTQIVSQDMGRALAWVRLFVQDVSIPNNKSIKSKNLDKSNKQLTK